jgi:hypothetical protein
MALGPDSVTPKVLLPENGDALLMGIDTVFATASPSAH